jgi:RNA polymerase sigma-70 factor (ECF subfamily)
MNFFLVACNLPTVTRMPVTPEQLYEQVLVVRSQLGDEVAFRELFALHGPRLLHFTQRMMASTPEHVADLLQEIWLAIFRSLPALRDAAKVRPWSFRVARDRIFREYRRRKIAVQPIGEEHLENLPAGEESALETEDLHRGLDTLSPEHREVLHLRFFEDLSYEDIARLIGSSIGTVRSRLHYAKLALKSALKGTTP